MSADEGRRLVPLVVGLVLVGVAGVGVYLWLDATAPPVLPPLPAPPAASRPPAESESAAPPRPARRAPPLAASDAVVRSWAAEVVEHPRLVRWLATDDVVRRFVAAVDDVARGESPRRHLEDLRPDRGFTVREDLDRVSVDPAGYARYDAVADAVAAIDTAAAVRLYHDLRPLFEEAYGELGYPPESFHATFLAALDRLLATPRLDGPVLVEPHVRSYRFADPRLEALEPAQKHLVRMGPANARKVASKLRLLRQVLVSGLPPETSPGR